MPFIDINFKPTARQVKQFGVTCLVAFPLLCWFCGFNENILIGSVVAGGVIAAASSIRPRLVAPIFVAASLITAPIGMVLGEITLLFVYVIAFVPLGLAFRLFRRDALLRRVGSSDSYWQTRNQSKDVASYYRQF